MATDRRRNAVEDKQELATTIGLYVLSEIRSARPPSGPA